MTLGICNLHFCGSLSANLHLWSNLFRSKCTHIVRAYGQNIKNCREKATTLSELDNFHACKHVSNFPNCVQMFLLMILFVFLSMFYCKFVL